VLTWHALCIDHALMNAPPATDPLLARCLSLWQAHEAARSPVARAAAFARATLAALSGGGGGASGRAAPSSSSSSGGTDVDDEVVFLPTTCLALLDALATARPAHRLIAADFDDLPGTTHLF
jgi:hypothetical protein